jgi:hypothetical protein
MNLSVTGSAVTAGLLADGHTVRAHVRSISSADRLPAGAGHVSGDLGDVAWLRASTDESDGVVHAAYATSGSFDAAFLDVAPSALSALAGSDRPLVYTGGTWVHGSRDPITEESPGQPTADGRPAPGNPATVADRGRRWHPNGRHRPGRRVRCRRLGSPRCFAALPPPAAASRRCCTSATANSTPASDVRSDCGTTLPQCPGGMTRISPRSRRSADCGTPLQFRVSSAA